jgi:molybdate transport system regulatory protein
VKRQVKAKSNQPQIRVLLGSAVAIGPGKASLIEAIGRTGSISSAAREMGMSYRRAWVLVDTMNRCFTNELVNTTTGGPGGRGAQVTDLGREVVRRYRAMEAKAANSVVGDMKGITRLLRGGG